MVGHLCLPHAFFNHKVFILKKNMIYFFNCYFVPKLFNSLNSCGMMKEIIIKTFKPYKKI